MQNGFFNIPCKEFPDNVKYLSKKFTSMDGIFTFLHISLNGEADGADNLI